MKTATKAILFAILLLVPGASLHGQEETPPDPPVAEPEKRPAIDPLLLDPGELVALLHDDLIYWPEERGQKASDMIFLAGSETIEHLMGLLAARDYRVKPAASDLLSRFDHRDAWDPIRGLLVHPGLKSKVKHLFKSLHRLDPEKTILLCEELLAGKKRTLRKGAFQFLLAQRDLSARKESLVRLCGSPDADVRRHAFLLLGKADLTPEETWTFALPLVGDSDARLAGEVLNVLGLIEAGPPEDGRLTALLDSADDRRRSHALLVLAMREFNLGETGISADDAAGLEELMTSRDPLVRVSAAAALTVIHLRFDEGGGAREGRIVTALMEVFLGSLYCRDFSTLLDVSVRCLRNLTGAPFTRDLTFWKAWWSEKSGSYQEKQKLFALTGTDQERLLVTFERTGPPYPVRFRIGGEGLIKNAAFRRTSITCFAGADSMKSAVEALYAGSYFERAATAAAAAEIASTDAPAANRVTIALAIDEREVSLTVDDPLLALGDSVDPQLVRIVDAVRHLFTRNAWQLLYGDQDFETWYFDNVDWWEARENEPLKTALFLERFRTVQNLLSEEAQLACFKWLSGRLDLDENLDVETWGGIARKLRGRGAVDNLVRATVDLALAAGADGGDLADRLFEPLTNYLFVLFRERSIPVIEEVLFRMGRITESLRHESWYVRAAAARVLRRLETNSVPQLISMVSDPHSSVRIEAMRSLAHAGTAECRDLLMNIAEREDANRALEVLAALDRLGTTWSFTVIERCTLKDSDAVRAAAVKAASRFDTPQAAELIAAQLNGPGASDRWPAAAVEHLVEAGGDVARNALFRVFGDNPDHALLTANALADLGDTRIVPALLEILEGSASSKEVERSLALLLAVEYDGETRRYRELWEENAGRSQAFFLKRTLAAGIETADEPSDCFEEIPVSLLVSSLTDARWFVRLASLRILEEGSGLSFGHPGRNASMLDMNRIRYDWNAWLGSR